MSKIGLKHFTLAPLAGAVLLSVAAPRAEAQVVYAISPSLSVAAVHDDNIFLQPEGSQSDDRITRYTPGLAVDITNGRLSFTGSYSQDAEYYEEHPALDSSVMRRTILTALNFNATQRLRIGLSASYYRTPTPGDLNFNNAVAQQLTPELNLAPGLLQLGRVETIRHGLGADVAYAFSPTLDGLFSYTGIDDDTALGISGRQHEGRARFRKGINSANTLLFGYTFRQFDFDSAPGQDSHTALIGWEHELSPRTLLTAEIGPRYLDGKVEPAIDVKLNHDFGTGEFELGYISSESLLAGQTARMQSEVASLLYTQRIGDKFSFTIAPQLAETESDLGATIRVRQIGVDARYLINNYVSVSASWQGSRQAELIVGGFRRDMPRDVALIALNFVWPIRKERP